MNLLAKITLIVLVGSVVAISSVGYLTYSLTRGALEKISEDQQLSLARESMDKIDRFLNERFNEMVLISTTPTIQNYLADSAKLKNKDFQKTNEMDKKIVQKRLGDFTTMTGPWDDLQVVDTTGNTVFSTITNTEPGTGIGQNSEIAFEAAISGHNYYSDVLVSDKTHKPTIIFAAPIKNSQDPGNPIIGIVIGELSWQGVSEVIKSDKSHRIDLYNSRGIEIANNENIDSAILKENNSNNPNVSAAIRGEERSGIEKDEIGVETVSSSVPEKGFSNYKGNKWVLLVKQPTKIALASANQTVYTIITILVLVSIPIVIIILFLILHFILYPIKNLTKITQEIASGNLNQTIEVNSNDEIGQLGRSFNAMTEKLRGFYQDLEGKINQKTGELLTQMDKVNQQNRSLQESQKAMFNLLEDSRELEKELEKQKSAVELKVTERTRQLTEEQARLQASIDSINFGFVITGKDCQIVSINGLAKRILCNPKAYVTSGLISSPDFLYSSCSMEDVQQSMSGIFDIVGEIKKCISEKRTVNHKEVIIYDHFFRFVISPVVLFGNNSNQALEVIGASVLIEDKTEERIMERSKDEFFSIASHELRTPLTAIRGNSSMVKEYFAKELENPQLKEMIDDIHESSIRLIEIVNDFLNVSRLEQGKIDFKKQEFDLNKVINECMSELQNMANDKNLNLNISSEPNIPKILADPNRTKEVVTNLLSNAIKYTESGSISIDVKLVGDFVYVQVIDTGRGIPFKQQGLLFRKFQQTGESLLTRDNTKGTGLGLYISKLLVEGMDGEIKMEKSIEGKGTTFSFTLPVVKTGENEVISQPLDIPKKLPPGLSIF